MLYAWLIDLTNPPSLKLKRRDSQFPQGRSPFHIFVRETHERFFEEHYSTAFLAKCTRFQKHFEENVMLCNQNLGF